MDSRLTQTQAVLNFQTGGKLIYLPFKEGDTISQGQTIAQLDTYALQQQLQIAANNYQATKNGTSQTQESQQAGVLEGQQRTSLDQTNKQGYSEIPQTQVIYDNIQRIVKYCEKDVLAIARVLSRFMNLPGIEEDNIESVTFQ